MVPLADTVAEAQAAVANQRGRLDAATVAWLDQASTALAREVSMDDLVASWDHPEETGIANEYERREQFLARLSTAMATVAKARDQGFAEW